MAGRKHRKWGILFSGDKLAMEDLLHYARLAEEAGAESIWSAELWRDAFVPLTAMASQAKRVRVGTAVAHFARPPMLTELSAMALAEYTGGRFVLGLGTAPREWNEKWHGLDYTHPVRRMREYIECIRAMWRARPDRPINFSGEFYKVSEYRRLMAPAYDRVPIYLAGVLPNMIRLSGSDADGLIVNVLNTPRYLTELVHPNLKKGLDAGARSRADFELCVVKCCAVSKNRKEAIEFARHAIAFYATIPYFDAILNPAGFQQQTMAIRSAMRRGDIDAALSAVNDEMVEGLTLAGSPDDIQRQLERFAGLFDTLILASPSFAADPEEVRENHRAIIEAFADGSLGH
jgi:probable F420-dependent oxidoreductase